MKDLFYHSSDMLALIIN